MPDGMIIFRDLPKMQASETVPPTAYDVFCSVCQEWLFTSPRPMMVEALCEECAAK